MLDKLVALSTMLLAISLATERLVTVMKTLLPKWLNEERTDSLGHESPVADRWRRFVVQLISFLAAWLTASFLREVDSGRWPFGGIKIIEGQPLMPVIVVALLSMGGSAFWNNILGYSKAVKDIRVQEKERQITTSPTRFVKRTNAALISAAQEKLRSAGIPSLTLTQARI